jgi:hypothetical protein
VASKKLKPLCANDEERFTVLAGGIAGAWIAFEGGADPANCMRAVWECLQELVEERSQEGT